jgi:abhydrolase domain-containing protein 11
MHGLLGSRANWNAMSKMLHSKTNRKVSHYASLCDCLLCMFLLMSHFIFLHIMFQVFAVDARNHGDSPHTKELSYDHLAEDLRSLVNDLAIKRATFIGHSMGGRAVMLLGLRYVRIIKNLIRLLFFWFHHSDSTIF